MTEVRVLDVIVPSLIQISISADVGVVLYIARKQIVSAFNDVPSSCELGVYRKSSDWSEAVFFL